ncbi:MAG TPA: transglycosylase SLT domain-containing protein [Candidatus Acidoferrales bacterium]|nr:transglycosylase SLT domain-containing protein [Candidatus Acidoferrales bacterium]
MAEIHKRSASILTPLRSCGDNRKAPARKFGYVGILAALAALAMFTIATSELRAAAPQNTAKKTGKKSSSKKAPVKTPVAAATANASATPLEKQLTQLSRALRDQPNATAYSALSAFATRNAKNEIGARAALALGYYDINRDKPELASGWLHKASGEKMLRDYVLYWQAEASVAMGQKDVALEQFQSILRDYPGSAITEPTVMALAQTAIAITKPADALAALNAYPNTTARPALMLLRAQARQALSTMNGEKATAAGTDYLDIYYRFPLNDEAKTAGQQIPVLQSVLGDALPAVPLQTQIARAEAFYLAKRWRDASTEYANLMPKLAGVDHQRADLRIVQCEVELGGKLDQLVEIPLTDPELDAERIFSIAQAHRGLKLEAQLLDDVEELQNKYPQSSWTAEALFSVGNFYWVNLDRVRATDFYLRSLAISPDGKNAFTADWRVAWTAYLDRKPEAADMLEAYIRRFPSSSYVQDALYWIGRSYEHSGNLELARNFYLAGAKRFPLTYFGAKAADRIRREPEGIGATPMTLTDFSLPIPAAPALTSLDQPVVVAAQERQARARVLSEIAFDSSAELEYRAAYAATHSPKFLIDAAGAAIAAGHYGAGMAAVRQAIPQLEARRITDVPNEAWRAAFPLPYEINLRSAAARNLLDPMLVAGLIRQESGFESKALSRAGAIGLMQVEPTTALKLARQLKVRYARARLTDPGYNLQLGSRYLANLIQAFGTREAALAAYNAGEDRVEQWSAGQNYLETAEFVESIPFTETREYVQIVIRNSDAYRSIYGPISPGDREPTRLSTKENRKTVAAQPVAATDTQPAAAGETR